MELDLSVILEFKIFSRNISSDPSSSITSTNGPDFLPRKLTLLFFSLPCSKSILKRREPRLGWETETFPWLAIAIWDIKRSTSCQWTDLQQRLPAMVSNKSNFGGWLLKSRNKRWSLFNNCTRSGNPMSSALERNVDFKQYFLQNDSHQQVR